MGKDVEKGGGDRTVTERIDFTKHREIHRNLPTILSDSALMTVNEWDSFCEEVDKGMKPMNRTNSIIGCLWIVITIMFVLMGTAHMFVPIDTVIFLYSIMGVLCTVLGIAGCFVGGKAQKKAESNVMKTCAKTSNRNRDVSMKLNTNSQDPRHWFINVEVKNVHVDANEWYDEGPTAVAVPVATGGGGAPPKKYVMDSYGNMRLNPDYKEWKLNNP